MSGHMSTGNRVSRTGRYLTTLQLKPHGRAISSMFHVSNVSDAATRGRSRSPTSIEAGGRNDRGGVQSNQRSACLRIPGRQWPKMERNTEKSKHAVTALGRARTDSITREWM
jgi:hypothetical protein